MEKISTQGSERKSGDYIGGKFVCVKSRLGGCEVTRVQAIENHALDGCPGIEKEGRLLSEAKGHGERERL